MKTKSPLLKLSPFILALLLQAGSVNAEGNQITIDNLATVNFVCLNAGASVQLSEWIRSGETYFQDTPSSLNFVRLQVAGLGSATNKTTLFTAETASSPTNQLKVEIENGLFTPHGCDEFSGTILVSHDPTEKAVRFKCVKTCNGILK